MELQPGAVFADHEIRGLVGRGGMGVVYRALHRSLDREVALKLIVPDLSADEEFRTRFQRESRVAASLDHPHAIPIYHAGESDGLLYITMRFVDGTDLRQELGRHGPLAPERVATIARQIAGALHAAHGLGIVHRDVKPANILLAGTEGEPHAYLTDFGLTKLADADAELTSAGMLVGSFDYIAPEQLDGDVVDARTDVYALGCVIYEALTGTVPFPRETEAAKMFAHATAPPPSVRALAPHAPARFDELVRTAMAKDPAERFQSAADFAEALRTAAASFPLPPALLPQAGEEPFVGRAEALARLRERFEQTGAGEHRLVLLTGEPGMGKSRLAREFARHAQAEGAVVLHGHCDAEPLAPYQPFTAGIRFYLANSDAVPDEDLAPLVPELRRRRAPGLPGAPESERYQLFEAVARLLTEASARHPLVLVIDDLHWADKPTILLLRHVVERTAQAPVLLVCTARAEEMADPLTQLWRDPACERLALAGFDDGETAELVAAHLKRDPSAGFVKRMRERTAGNPFFIGEVLRAGASEQALDRIPVPEGVKELIGQRLNTLTDDTRRVLALAAVLGPEFKVTVLEALAGEDDVLTALEAAEAAGLVHEAQADRFAFAHALVRETLYERPSASRRVRVHRQVGELLEQLPAPSAAELAHHFYEAREVGGAAKAVDYALKAAEEATESVAYEEASAHYRKALAALELAHPGNDYAHAEILLALGQVLTRAGDPEARATFMAAADVARERNDATQLARAALGLGWHYAEAGVVDRPLIAMLEEASGALTDADAALRARVLARLADALMFAGEPERTLRLSRLAVDEARRAKDDEAVAAALTARHGALLHTEHLQERLTLSWHMLSLAERSGHRELEGLARHRHIYDLVEDGQLDRAREQHAGLASLGDELRQPLLQHFATGWGVVWAQMDGRFEDAQQLAGQCFEYGRRAQSRDAPTQLAGQMLSLQRQREGLGGVIEAIEAALEQYPALVAWRAVLPLAHMDAGNTERAREIFETFAADDFRIVPRDMFWLTAVTVLGEACALLGDAERAATLYALLEPYKSRNVQVGAAACFGSTERFLAELAAAMGDTDLAVEHYANALTMNERWGNKPVVAMVQLGYATTLLDRGAPGDRERSAELLKASLEGADRMGMPFIRRRVPSEAS